MTDESSAKPPAMGAGPSSWAPGSVGSTYCHRSSLGRPMWPLMSKKLCDPAGWWNGPTGLEPLRINWSSSKVWQFTWCAVKTRSMTCTSSIKSCNQNLLQDKHDQQKSAQATTTHLWMDSRPPFNTCYWRDTQNPGKISCNSWHPQWSCSWKQHLHSKLNLSGSALSLFSQQLYTSQRTRFYSSSKGSRDLFCYPIELRLITAAHPSVLFYQNHTVVSSLEEWPLQKFWWLGISSEIHRYKEKSSKSNGLNYKKCLRIHRKIYLSFSGSVLCVQTWQCKSSAKEKDF